MERIFEKYPQLECCKEDMEKALNLIINTYKKDGKILVCGNGGSAADSEHIVGELMKGFLSERKINDERLSQEVRDNLQGALPAISLCSQTALTTAFANDLNPDYVFAQQVYGYAKENDLLIAITTSGNSANVVNAVKVAKEIGIDEVHAELLPEDKFNRLEAIICERGRGSVYVGDGINDAPVLARADIGVAMGGIGSDAAIEAADVVLMTDEVTKLAKAIEIARKTRQIVTQNIVFALGVKALFLIMGAFGIATMFEAVFADVGVALIAVFNAMRIMKVK